MILPAAETFNFDELLMLYRKNVKNYMRPWIGRLCFRLIFLLNEPFLDLSRPYCRAGPFRRESDTPRPRNLYILLVFGDLLFKSEKLHAALDWEVGGCCWYAWGATLAWDCLGY